MADILTFRGKNIADMTREELIEAAKAAGQVETQAERDAKYNAMIRSIWRSKKAA